nr:unnamed protein product [Callosobruchus analis]
MGTVFKDKTERWHKEYLTKLQRRPIWLKPAENIKPNTVVLIKEDNLAPLQWKLGRVIEVCPGSDKKVRVVKLRTKDGIFTRPITKINDGHCDTSSKLVNEIYDTSSTWSRETLILDEDLPDQSDWARPPVCMENDDPCTSNVQVHPVGQDSDYSDFEDDISENELLPAEDKRRTGEVVVVESGKALRVEVEPHNEHNLLPQVDEEVNTFQEFDAMDRLLAELADRLDEHHY